MRKKMEYQLPVWRYIWDRRKSVKDNEGVASVELEIMHKRKRRWASTGIRCRRKEWDVTRSKVVCRNDMIQMNAVLNDLAGRINEVFEKLALEGREWEWGMMDDLLANKKVAAVVKPTSFDGWAGESFIEWMEERIEERKDIKKCTKRTHIVTLHLLKAYNACANGYSIVKYGDLKEVNIVEWDKWLHQRNVKQATIKAHHTRLGQYIKEAVYMRRVEYSPYMYVKIKGGKSVSRRYLSLEEVRLLECTEFEQKGEKMAKDMFLFQCYTGMSYSDMMSFDLENCKVINGKLWMLDRRIKTDELYRVLIIDKARDIVMKHFGRFSLTIHWYNVRLKSIQAKLGIRTKLTSHVARHTFAMIALNSGVKLEVLSKMLGHTNIRTTQIYGQILPKRVEESFMELEKLL